MFHFLSLSMRISCCLCAVYFAPKIYQDFARSSPINSISTSVLKSSRHLFFNLGQRNFRFAPRPSKTMARVASTDNDVSKISNIVLSRGETGDYFRTYFIYSILPHPRCLSLNVTKVHNDAVITLICCRKHV